MTGKKLRTTDRDGNGSPRSNEGDLRVGPLLAIPSLLVGYGLDPSRVFRRVGLDIRLFDDSENRISIVALGRLIESCVALTGCQHFGLLVGQRSDTRTLGALGYLMRNSRTVGDALHSLSRHLHVNDRGAVPALMWLDANRVKFVYTIYVHEVPAMAQIYDGAIAIIDRMLRELCGPSWKPLAVLLSHGEPADVAPFEQCFGMRPRFNSRLSGIVFSSAWLGRTVTGADPVLHDILASAIALEETSEPLPFAAQVRRALWPMVYSGNASIAALSSLFGLKERTLRRKLDAEGTSVHQLVNEARFEVAQQLLRNTQIPVARIATLLHYSGAPSFSRAFRGFANISPRAWRERLASGAGARSGSRAGPAQTESDAPQQG